MKAVVEEVKQESGETLPLLAGLVLSSSTCSKTITVPYQFCFVDIKAPLHLFFIGRPHGAFLQKNFSKTPKMYWVGVVGQLFRNVNYSQQIVKTGANIIIMFFFERFLLTTDDSEPSLLDLYRQL